MTWLAKDSGGDWYVYPKEPKIQGNQHWSCGGEYIKYKGDRIIPNILWEESLQNMNEPFPTTQLDRIEEMLKQLLNQGQDL